MSVDLVPAYLATIVTLAGLVVAEVILGLIYANDYTWPIFLAYAIYNEYLFVREARNAANLLWYSRQRVAEFNGEKSR